VHEAISHRRQQGRILTDARGEPVLEELHADPLPDIARVGGS
jgi:hypothetical protein